MCRNFFFLFVFHSISFYSVSRLYFIYSIPFRLRFFCLVCTLYSTLILLCCVSLSSVVLPVEFVICESFSWCCTIWMFRDILFYCYAVSAVRARSPQTITIIREKILIKNKMKCKERKKEEKNKFHYPAYFRWMFTFLIRLFVVVVVVLAALFVCFWILIHINIHTINFIPSTLFGILSLFHSLAGL